MKSKMFSVVVVICCNIGILSARQPDVDINRLQLLSNELTNSLYINKDHDGLLKSEKYTQTSTNLKPVYEREYDKPSQIYKPRVHPRFYYQSDAYTKDVMVKHPEKISWELPQVYPDDVTRRNENLQEHPPAKTRSGRHKPFSKDSKLCVKCPRDRTLVAKKGSDRVFLQKPRLTTCSGRMPPRNVRFLHLYGPEFGSLVKEGSHVIIGRINFGNLTLRTCKMQAHVVTQGCRTPKYLVAHCKGVHCSFSCSDSRLKLHGDGGSSLECGDDMRWKGELPVCVGTRTSCQPPPPPEHGSLTCQGAVTGTSLVEGSRCRVRCQRGWRAGRRASTVCRGGAWTKTMLC